VIKPSVIKPSLITLSIVEPGLLGPGVSQPGYRRPRPSQRGASSLVQPGLIQASLVGQADLISQPGLSRIAAGQPRIAQRSITRHGTPRHGTPRQGLTRHSLARPGLTRPGIARLSLTGASAAAEMIRPGRAPLVPVRKLPREPARRRLVAPARLPGQIGPGRRACQVTGAAPSRPAVPGTVRGQLRVSDSRAIVRRRPRRPAGLVGRLPLVSLMAVQPPAADRPARLQGSPFRTSRLKTSVLKAAGLKAAGLKAAGLETAGLKAAGLKAARFGTGRRNRPRREPLRLKPLRLKPPCLKPLSLKPPRRERPRREPAAPRASRSRGEARRRVLQPVEPDHVPGPHPELGQGLARRNRAAVRVLEPPAVAAYPDLAGVQARHGQDVGEQPGRGDVHEDVDLVLPERADHGDPLAVLISRAHAVLTCLRSSRVLAGRGDGRRRYRDSERPATRAGTGACLARARKEQQEERSRRPQTTPPGGCRPALGPAPSHRDAEDHARRVRLEPAR
jgi:hypothetical protein